MLSNTHWEAKEASLKRSSVPTCDIYSKLKKNGLLNGHAEPGGGGCGVRPQLQANS